MAHSRKRKSESNSKGRLPPQKKFKKQRTYSSGSSDGSEDSGDELIARKTSHIQVHSPTLNSAVKPNPSRDASPSLEKSLAEESSQSEEATSDSASEDGHEGENGRETQSPDENDTSESAYSSDNGSEPKKRTKRHDPSAFANSLNTILNTKLSNSKRQDPVLSRSRDAQEAGHELAESRLEMKAKKKLREEKKLASERGRVKNVLLGDRNDAQTFLASNGIAGELEGMSAADVAEQERRLRKTAQRGVVKLFNAVRAAQVKSEEATKQVRLQGVVGEKKRGDKINEMGRNAFLEMVGAGGKG